MKHVFAAFLAISSLPLLSQGAPVDTLRFQCYVETYVETVTAYSITAQLYNWLDINASASPREKRDSIGLRTQRVTRIYYIDEGERIYPWPERIERLSGPEDRYSSGDHARIRLTPAGIQGQSGPN